MQINTAISTFGYFKTWKIKCIHQNQKSSNCFKSYLLISQLLITLVRNFQCRVILCSSLFFELLLISSLYITTEKTVTTLCFSHPFDTDQTGDADQMCWLGFPYSYYLSLKGVQSEWRGETLEDWINIYLNIWIKMPQILQSGICDSSRL